MKRRRIDHDLTHLSERQWQKRIEDRARELGALTCHVNKARMVSGNWITPTSDAGFPDLWCLFANGRLVVFECKTEGAPPSTFKERQREWIGRLQKNPGVRAFMVRPSDWPKVELLLDAAARPDVQIIIDQPKYHQGAQHD